MQRKPHGYYDDVNHIIEEISICDSKMEFRLEHNGAYYACRKIGKYEEMCRMLSVNQDYILWNNRALIGSEAKNYTDINQFALLNGSAFAAAHRLNILEEVCSHMQSVNKKDVDISDESITRILEIASKCSNFDEFRKDHSEEYIIALRKNIIQIVANKIPSGGIVISLNELFKLAEKCDNYNIFANTYKKELRLARLSGNIKVIKQYYQDKQRDFLYSCKSEDNFKDHILEFASRCENYNDFHDNYSLIYAEARKRGLLSEVYKILPKVKSIKYSKRKIISLAKKYKSRRDFAIQEASAYNAALENGWLSDIDTILPRKKRKAYDEQQILSFAKKCESYSQFIREYRYAYVASIRLGIIEKVKSSFSQ